MILFPDSNVFVHFQPIENWDWKTAQDDSLQIGLCSSIINELDKIKYSGNNNSIKRRVQALVKKFGSSSPLNLNNISFVIYLPNSNSLQDIITKYHLDKNDKDDLFIASVLEYSERHPLQNVQIISNDLGVQLKCKAYNIIFNSTPEEYLIQEEDTLEKEIKRLSLELNRIKNLQPKLRLQFDNGEIHKQFTLNEPWKEYQDEIKGEMEAVKHKFPFLEPDIDDKKEAFQLLNLYKKTPEKVEDYNKALQEYYSKYEVYLHKNKVYAYKEKLTIILNIELANIGNTPAENIDLEMHFPDGFKLGDKNDYYAKDTEPQPPDLSFYSMAPFDFSTIMHSLPMPTFSNINLGGFSITKSNSYDVKDHFNIIKHNHVGLVNQLYVMFDRFEETESFEITYKITAANMIDIEDGKLHVIINKVQYEDWEEEG